MDCLFNGPMPYTISFEYDERLDQYETTLALCAKVKELCKRINELPAELQNWAIAYIKKQVDYLLSRIQDVEADMEHTAELVANLIERQNEFEKEMDGLFQMWATTATAKVDAKLMQQDAAIEAVRAYCRELVAECNVLILSLQKTIAQMLVSANAYTDTEVKKLRNAMISIISDENANHLWVINPVDGQSGQLYNVLSDMLAQIQTLSLTAAEYDAIGLTAEQYDALALTAAEYDKRGWLLLFKQKYIEPLYGYVDQKDGEWTALLSGRINRLDKQVFDILSPISGTYVDLYTMILQLVSLSQKADTAAEYDALQVEAAVYDAKDLTAHTYDFHGYPVI